MNRMVAAAKNWILGRMETVESLPWGPGTLGLLLAAVIVVRNLLEIRVAQNPVFEGLAVFVHYPLAYVAPFVALTLVLAGWGRVAPIRVARLMVLAWLLTLLPPLADLLLHPGIEKPTIAYLQADPSELGRIWLRFFDPTVPLVGTTLGIRVEAFLAVVMAAVFVRLKGQGWFRTVFAAVSVYGCSLFFFSLPLLVVRFFRLFLSNTTLGLLLRGEGVLIRPDRDTSPDSVSILWLVLILVGLMFFWRWRERSFAEEDAFPSLPGAKIPWGPCLILSACLLCGLLAARKLHFPAEVFFLVPFDLLAVLGALVGLSMLVAAALRPKESGSAAGVLLLAGGLALAAALGRSVGLGLLAAAAPWIPWGRALIPPRWKIPYGVLACGLSGFAAFAAGYGLITGPEGLARIPMGTAGPALGMALGFGPIWATGGGTGSRWWAVPVCGFSLALGGLLAGDLRVLAVFVPAGLLAGLLLWGADHYPWPSGKAIAAFVLGILALFLSRGLLNTGFLAEKWTKQATCLPALDVARGNQLANRGEWSAAASAYRRAMACDGNYVPALRGLALGILRFEKERAPRAIELLTRAADLAPDSPPDLVNLGAALIQDGKAKEALVPLRRALSFSPENLNATANLAQALEDSGQKEEARIAWQRYLELASGRPEEEQTVGQARQHLRHLDGRKGADPPKIGRPPSR